MSEEDQESGWGKPTLRYSQKHGPEIEKLRAGIVTRSAEEMEDVAASFCPTLPPDSAIALYGELGTGKTTFVRGLARALGISDTITSPTYNIYYLYRGQGKTNLLHLDAYRLDNETQYDELLIEDFLVTPYLLAIEWPENLGNRLPQNCLHLHFTIIGENRHRIQWKEVREKRKP